MRTVCAVLILLLMLSGCAKQEAPTRAPVGTPPVQSPVVAPAPEIPASIPPDAPPAPPTPGSIEALLPVPAPLPEELRRVELSADQQVENVGLYFVDVAIGKMEGWLTPLGEQGMPALSLWSSEDERWIEVQKGSVGYLVRRSDGAAFRYDRERIQIKVGPGVLLAMPAQHENGGLGLKCALLNTEAQLVATFAIEDRCARYQQIHFSPDGKHLAILGANSLESLWLVDTTTGAVKDLGRLKAPDGLQIAGLRLSSLSRSGELVAETFLVDPAQIGKQVGSLIRRFSWQGELRSERRISGGGATFSPDGKLVMYQENLNGLGQAVVVQEWGAGQQRFRLAGGLGAQWLADSKAMLINTFRGRRLVSADGAPLVALPAPGVDTFQPFSWLTPAPDSAELFLTGDKVIDRHGNEKRSVRTPEGKDLRVQMAEWGATSRSYHVLVAPAWGKGYDADFTFYLEPQVQRPPYPAEFPLQVDDPKGECLTLRAEAGAGAKVVRCLPTGTRLALPDAEPVTQYEGEWVWLQVKTEQGELGWVAINTRSVAYAK